MFSSMTGVLSNGKNWDWAHRCIAQLRLVFGIFLCSELRKTLGALPRHVRESRKDHADYRRAANQSALPRPTSRFTANDEALHYRIY